MDRPVRSGPSHLILKPRPNCPPNGVVQWGTCHYWWPEGDCIGWLWSTGLQCELRVLQWMTLKVHPLDRLLELDCVRGSAIPYLGYVEVNLQIPGIRGYNEDVLLLVILTMTYSEQVLVMEGSKIIDRAIRMITKGELARATMTWKQLYLSHSSCSTKWKGGQGCCKRVTPSTAPNPTAPKEFCLDDVQGHVCTTQLVSIHPFGTINIHGTQTSEGTVCRSMCLLSQHEAPAGCLHCMGCHIWRVTPMFLQGVNLSEEPECPPHCNPYQGSCWKNHSSQPVPPVVLLAEPLGESAHGPRKRGSWRNWASRV